MKGVSFERNCGAASAGECNLVLSIEMITYISHGKQFLGRRFER